MTRLEQIEKELKKLSHKLNCGTQFFETTEEFPEVGKECAIYVDKSTGALYVYDKDTGTYVTADSGEDAELSGSGVNEQVTYWTGSTTLGGDGEFTYNSTTNLLKSGNLELTNLQPATVDTDKFLVSDTGVLKIRTGAEVLSDIGGVGGTGTSGQVAYFNGTSSVTGSAGLTWDDALKKLTVLQNLNAQSTNVNTLTVTSANTNNGTAIEDVALQINYNSTSSGGVGGVSKIGLRIDGTGNYNKNVGTYVSGLYVSNYSGSTYNNNTYVSAKFDSKVIIGGTGYSNINTYGIRPQLLQFDGTATTDQDTPTAISFGVGNTTGAQGGMLGYQGTSRLSAVWLRRSWINGSGDIVFATNDTNGGNLQDRGIIDRLGNYGIGIATTPSARLHVRGSGTTSATTALLVQNSTPSELFKVLDNGVVTISNGSSILSITPSATVLGPVQLQTSGSTSQIELSAANGRKISITGSNSNASGDFINLQFTTTFTPTSGTSTHVNSAITPTINQTGGANGITRGLYVNPTLTSAADWRSVEFSNATGKGIWGAGAADNAVAGNLHVGSATVANAVAIIEATSTTKGVLFPRMTTAQRDLIAAVAGLVIFNTTTTKLECYDGAAWQAAW